MNAEQNALLSSIADDMKALKGNIDSLQSTVNGLENKLVTHLRNLIREETRKFDNEIELMKGRTDNMEARFPVLTRDSVDMSDWLQSFCDCDYFGWTGPRGPHGGVSGTVHWGARYRGYGHQRRTFEIQD